QSQYHTNDYPSGQDVHLLWPLIKPVDDFDSPDNLPGIAVAIIIELVAPNFLVILRKNNDISGRGQELGIKVNDNLVGRQRVFAQLSPDRRNEPDPIGPLFVE